MKQGHLALLFLLVYVICWSAVFMEQQQFDSILREKQRVERALTEALENASLEFSEVIYASETEKKKKLEEEFLDNFYFSMGVIDGEENREYIRMYFPVFMLVEEDGAYFCYMEEHKKDGIEELVSTWSEKNFFEYPEGSTETEKKIIMTEMIEKKVSEIISKHNYIAEQYGFTYDFSVPRFLENLERKMEFPMLFVVFQGWPLNSVGNIVYENCLDAGLYLQRTNYFSVSRPKDILSPYCVYHKMDSMCKEKQNPIAEYVTEEDAVCRYGAFPCEICIQ